MNLDTNRADRWRDLPVVPFYLASDEAYAQYKRDCEAHLAEVYGAAPELSQIVPESVAIGILRANIKKRREHSQDARVLAYDGHMPRYSGAVAGADLHKVAEAHLSELVSNPQLPSMELEARITVGEETPLIDTSLADQVADDVSSYMNSVNMPSELIEAASTDESIKLSRISADQEYGDYAVLKTKVASGRIIGVENGSTESTRLQVVGRQTSIVRLDELDADERRLVERLGLEYGPDDDEKLYRAKRELIEYLGESCRQPNQRSRSVIERAYARRQQ